MHCTLDEEELSDVKNILPIPICGVNGARMHTSKMGMKMFQLHNSSTLTISGVLVIEDIALRLISISRLTNAGMCTLFDKTAANILALHDHCTVATATWVGTGLYSIDTEQAQINAATAGIQLKMWHGRFGHLPADHVKHAVQSDTVKGMHVDLSLRPPKCQPCICGKQKQTAVPKRQEGERSRAFLNCWACKSEPPHQMASII
jgi:hypothetical protein